MNPFALRDACERHHVSFDASARLVRRLIQGVSEKEAYAIAVALVERRKVKRYRTKPRDLEVPAGQKFCNACRQVLPLDAFGIDNSAKDSRNYRCKPCARRENRAVKRRLRTRVNPTHEPHRARTDTGGRL